MKLVDGELRFAATDLANHLACRHLSAQACGAAFGDLRRPFFHDRRRDALRERGLEHEASFLAHLRSQGLEVLELPTESDEALAAARAREAMASKVDVIAQATLSSGRWMGRADVLRRVQRPSALGDWSYEVMDTKLAQTTKAGTVLQLCLYSVLLEKTQGARPEWAFVVKPNELEAPERFRLDDYLAYFRLVRRQLEGSIPALWTGRSTYPRPVSHCDVCAWWTLCNERRREDDHLSLVAGLGRLQEEELCEWGVTTLAQFARVPVPLTRRPARGRPETYERLREQARLQLEARESGEPVFELLDPEPERGLSRLPTPSPGDVFFDIEGDPFAGDGGREYLLGLVEADADGPTSYSARWGLDAEAEKRNFERLIDDFSRRVAEYPDLHIFHYAPYEPAALKRLSGRYGTRQDALDELLRARRFVDLYAVVRQSLRAGIERYSIKELERFYGFERAFPLKDASKSLRDLEFALELGRLEALAPEVYNSVEGYNRDDCLSTLYLRDWLERLRSSLVEDGAELPRPELAPSAPTERLDARLKEIAAVAEPLRDGVSAEVGERTDEEHARWLLSHLLSWHRREEKAGWWEFFRREELDFDERLQDPGAIAGLRFVRRLPIETGGGTKNCPIDLYEYPIQDIDLRDHDSLYLDADTQIGTLAELDAARGTIAIKKSRDSRDVHPDSIFGHTHVSTELLAASLLRLGTSVLEHGFSRPPPRHRAALDLLLRHPPRLGLASGDPVRRPGDDVLESGRRAALDLCQEGGVLPIQGPPGAGKTYTGARMVLELVREGKSVGITAPSHTVISHFLDEVVEAARAEHFPLRAIQKVDQKDPDRQPEITETKSNRQVLSSLLSDDVQVAAGTAWLWAREDMESSVDALMVDEAGQMSLATALSVAPAGRALILIGDPQQLQQPLKASHPDGTEVSALEHVLGDRLTIPEDRGLFLDHTWRLQPEICRFTSEQFYESRLRPREDLERQGLRRPAGSPAHGLFYLPCEHAGHKNRSMEEAQAVRDLVETILGAGTSWTGRDGDEHPLGLADILIVAPYNAHVSALAKALPRARIGTVDKFQGQEAPLVIYSMATSSPEEAPRGMEFLYSRHRLNVATSRARCACVLVCSPALLEPGCRTPRQASRQRALPFRRVGRAPLSG